MWSLRRQTTSQGKLEYAGHWSGGGVDLVIMPQGQVSYTKVGTGKVEINGPVQAYDGEDLVVGALGITTTFDVQEPPHEVDGPWKMTVDGVELVRVAK